MKALDHPETIERRLRGWLAVSRRIAKQAQKRRVMPDFGTVAAGLEEALLPSAVFAYRKGLSQAKRMQPKSLRTKTIWQNPGDTFVTDAPVARRDDHKRGAFWLFAAGATLVAVAVRNTVARLIDWMDRSFKKAVGLPVPKPLGLGPGGVIPYGTILPMPVTGHNYHPIELPPKLKPPPIIVPPMEPGIPQEKPPEIVTEFEVELPTKQAITIVEDELHGLGQRAIIEYAKQTGALELMWHIEDNLRVCPVCKPLDEVTAKPGEPFGYNVDGSPIYSPLVHALCRCRLEITKWRNIKP